MDTAETRINGSCVAIDGEGVLLRGRPGSGKSDLALRLIDGGARLVADDWCDARNRGGRVWLSAPAAISNVMEVRGVGVVETAALPEAPLALVVDLDDGPIERMPEPDRETILGIAVPRARFRPFESSAAAKVRTALRVAVGAARLRS